MQVLEVKRIDNWDGGDRHDFMAYVSNAIPNDVIEKVYRNCHIVDEIITIFDDLKEINENSVRKLKESAYAKLTPLERKAIGLKL